MYEQTMLILMADHNRWINEKLYRVCAQIPDAERKRDLGAFFRSIHGTFNHLLLVDRLWLGRIRHAPLTITALDQELYTEFAVLHREHAKTDSDIMALVRSLTPTQLVTPVTYTSFVKQDVVTLPLGVIVIHLFHHQTHHRGQLTTLISQLGYDFGETDLIYMPNAQTAYFSSHSPPDQETL